MTSGRVAVVTGAGSRIDDHSIRSRTKDADRHREASAAMENAGKFLEAFGATLS